MAYYHFATLYDALMEDAPYDEWVEFTEKSIEKYHNKAQQILDIGCGTGEIAIRLAKKGYQVTGVDLSENMLAIAGEKAIKARVSLPLFQQNMSELEGFSSIDVALIFCDSLNYLETKDEVKETFKRVYESLADDGLFLFDVHSVYKIETVFANHLFGSNEEECSFLWQCQKGEAPHSVEHDLIFFVYDEEKNSYERFDEWHKQRTFQVVEYEQMLADAGFKVCEKKFDFVEVEKTNSERILFVVKKACK